MTDYKKIIKSQRVRFIILDFLLFIPDKVMLKWQYRLKLGRSLNWNHPNRFTEFIQLYKTKYRNPEMFRCVDKLEVREYVKDKGQEDILNQLLGVYQDATKIDFSKLPQKFVIKTTNGGGGENVLICKDSSALNQKEVIEKVNGWLKLKTVNSGREWAYDGITEPKIIIEKLLEDDSNPDGGIDDYKILCFNGEPKIVIFDCDRYIGHKRNFYDTDWNLLDVSSDCPNKKETIDPPKGLDKMLSIAKILSRDFPFVRVDLYNINGRIYFGELTFYPWSGYVQFTPDSFDFQLGSYFNKKIFESKNN
ncbi:MAG: carbonic anhydrase [Ruminococcus sp.]|nr:carbonic anhydrase [Ruminococcus sp.]